MKLETKDGHFVFTASAKERALGYLGENKTQSIRIQLDQDYPGWVFRMEFGVRKNYVYLTQEDGVLTVELERSWMPESGSIPVQICGTCGEMERRSNVVRFQLARSVGALDRPDCYPTAFRQLEQRILSMKQRVEQLYTAFGDMEHAILEARKAAAQAADSAVQAAASADTLVVRDTLSSEDTAAALSAHQGKVLNDRIHSWRFRDPMVLESAASYTKSGYTEVGGFCVSEDAAYVLFSGSSGQAIVSFDRAAGTEIKQTAALPETCRGLTWDSASGHVITCGTSYVYVLSASLTVLLQYPISGARCAAWMGDSKLAWCTSNAIVIGQTDGTEMSRLSLPTAISNPQSISYHDGIFYVSDTVSGTGRVTALDSDGRVIHIWLLSKSNGTLCGIQMEETQMILLFLSSGTAKAYRGNYAETQFFVPTV